MASVAQQAPVGRFAQLRASLKTSATESLQGTAGPVIMETIRLFPESLIIGAGLFALFTISFPMAVFFGTMVETSLLYRLFRTATEYLFAAPGQTGVQRENPKCRSGLYQADYTDVSLFAGLIRSNVFPSYPVFIATTAASYVFSTLNELSKELEILGPAYSSRYYTSMIFSSLLILVLVAYRTLYACDSLLSLFITIGLGFILGIILVQQNKGLFGRESLNMIGVPLLRKRTATGENIYICPK